MNPLSEDKVQEAISGGAAARSAVMTALDQLHVPCLLAEAACCQELTLKGPSHSANALNPRNRQPGKPVVPLHGLIFISNTPGRPRELGVLLELPVLLGLPVLLLVTVALAGSPLIATLVI